MATLTATTISGSSIPTLQEGDTISHTDINNLGSTLRTSINLVIADLSTLNTATGQLSATNAWTGTNSWTGTSTFNHITFASTYGVSNTFIITDSDNASTGVDTGVAANRGSSGADALFYWDHSESAWRCDTDSSGTLSKLQIAAATASGYAAVYEQVLRTTGAQSGITGVKAFDSYPEITTYAAPTTDVQFAPKKYIDDQTASLSAGGIIQQSSAPSTASGTLWIDTTTVANLKFLRANGSVYAPITGIHQGTSAPTTPTPLTGHLWIDTTSTNQSSLKRYDGSNWKQVLPATIDAATTFTASTTFSAGFSVASSQTIDFNSNILTEVGTPSASTDAANKSYVDTASPKVFNATALGGPSLTASETSLFGTGVGSKTLTANKLIAGSVIRATCAGSMSISNPQTITIKAKIGGVTKTFDVWTPGAITTQNFIVEVLMTCVTAGASGSVIIWGMAKMINPAAVGTEGVEFYSSTTDTINTTGTLAVDVTAQLSSAGDAMVTTIGLLEVEV